ncbi:uncharacterized protein THITE_156358 [Thermothielavioides terrestris NRRL 8126]|uniref:Uncharacterized protein n=1 Tax=Thermothielavioides terrestris (strain ATCC 38088 / NRRL 8126) TaxID=578455 RepID=G2RAH0_THETT|nr:uncharacterized protein THITE_156358 [Thermothielavioides terrestris NRRL 8126]AEO69705.1 hypothetical protein THITE_156358 [Thermothielavioides terrestris NRRL 8126]
MDAAANTNAEQAVSRSGAAGRSTSPARWTPCSFSDRRRRAGRGRTGCTAAVHARPRASFSLLAPAILVCLFAIDFGMLFLSTNNRKRIASDFHELDSAVWIILLDSISETALNPFLPISCAALFVDVVAVLITTFNALDTSQGEEEDDDGGQQGSQ